MAQISRTDDLMPRFTAFCRQHELLPDGGRVLVGLSGGPDSLTLLDLLDRLAPRHHLTICAAHLHHGLRGLAADQDEQAVREICAARGIDLQVCRLDIATVAKARGLTVEEAGREARYEFFTSIVQGWLAQPLTAGGSSRSLADQCLAEGIRIAVGHHRDDQAETVLMNLCRGSGLQGLGGMQPQNGLIIRPLLAISRELIERYVRMRGLSPCIDQTNAEPEATRNRLRIQVLPALRDAFAVDPAPAIVRAAALLRSDADYLNRSAAAELDRLLTGRRDNSLPVSGLDALHPAIRFRVLRLWFERVFGEMKDLSEKHVAAMDALGRPNRSGHHCSLPGGRRAVRDFDRLLLETANESTDGHTPAEGKSAEEFPLRVPGFTGIPNGEGFFVTQFIENAQQIVYNSQIWCFPATALTGAVVRHRQPQDHVRLDGRGCGKTLKKYLTEQKVPAFDRNRLPLIAKGSEILWIPGVTAARHLQRPDPALLPRDPWVLVRYQANEG